MRAEGDEGRRIIHAAGDERSIRRLEDERFLTGRGRYLDDAPAQGQLALAVLRSPHAHAAILSIDTRAAAAAPGVSAVLTAADLDAAGIGPLPCSVTLDPSASLMAPERLPLCRDRVRHVGDLVACVVAESRALALEALDLIAVDYDVLPAVTDLRRAGETGATEIWDEAPGNIAFRYRRGDEAATQAAFARAAHVVALDIVNNRVAAMALEPRAALGSYDPETGRYLLEVSGASVHHIRRELAESVLRIPLDQLDVVTPDVGGGFGMKNVPYPEYALVLFAARRLGRPVRWLAERIEDFTSGAHARDNLTRGRLALDAEGRFLAVAVETTANMGAYLSSLGPGPATNATASATGGLYAIPTMTLAVDGVFTNTAPVDAYRGAGKPEANYLIERLIDVAAARLGLDPIALRRKNLIAATPYRTPMGFTIDSGDFSGNLDRALAAADYAGFEARRAEAAQHGRMRGFGLSCFLETSRYTPNEEAWLRLEPDGVIEIAVGSHSNGQGHETSFVQLAAERLGLPLERFRYVQGDTRRVPRGGGHGGARSLHLGGTAVLMAADALLETARPLAARLLQAAPEDVGYEAGTFFAPAASSPTGGARRSIALTEIAGALGRSGPGAIVEGHAENVCDLYTFANGCHTCEVEVDPDTGEVRLLSYTAVDDYGNLVNPLLTEGQIHGGIAQGVGQALMEHAVYDPESGQLLSATLMDYAVPRGADLPRLDIGFVEIPTAANPMGVKGAGQAGAIAAPAAVMNAMMNALKPLGVEHIDMPATPERVWRSIRDASGSL